MQKSNQANINLKTLKMLLDENKDKYKDIQNQISDIDDILKGSRHLNMIELNKIASILKINMVSLYLTPEVYEKAYEFYKIIHQCKELEERVGFMNKFGIHFTKMYDDFLLEKAIYCPYCGFKLTE